MADPDDLKSLGGARQREVLKNGNRVLPEIHRNTLKPHDAHTRLADGLVSAYNVRGEALNLLQDKTPRFVPAVRGERHELPAVKAPTSTPDGLQWAQMGSLSAAKNTVGLHEMNSVIHSLGWQLDKLRREASV